MNKNKFGIYTSPNFNEGTIEDTVAAIKKAGFEYTFFAWKKDADYSDLLKIYEKYGILLDSLHAPFMGLNCMWNSNASDGDDYVKMLCDCIDDTKRFGAPNVVMHPISGDSVPFCSKIGLERWKRIIDHANKIGVKVCFENVEFSEMLGIVMHEFGDQVGFCYDTGHESTNDPGINFMKLFGDRLSCTHIHDNYGLSYLVTPVLHGDCHMIPLDATIDFKRVMKDIRDADYKGVLMMECNRHGMLNTYADLSAEEFYQKAYNAMKTIAEY